MRGIPEEISHIGADPFDPAYDARAAARAMEGQDQRHQAGLAGPAGGSGIGNIYADEALWRAQIHGERAADSLTAPAIERLLGHAQDVMTAALDQGGDGLRCALCQRQWRLWVL